MSNPWYTNYPFLDPVNEHESRYWTVEFLGGPQHHTIAKVPRNRKEIHIPVISGPPIIERDLDDATYWDIRSEFVYHTYKLQWAAKVATLAGPDMKPYYDETRHPMLYPVYVHEDYVHDMDSEEMDELVIESITYWDKCTISLGELELTEEVG